MVFKTTIQRFLFRWFVNALGLWMASRFFGGISYQEKAWVLIVAGAVLALINGLIKPMVLVLSIPAILLTLGLFTLVVNGFMILLINVFYKPFLVRGLGTAILTGLVISLVNYLVTSIIDPKARK